jgi:threonine/homoserine efflux transporter RhtA
MKTVLLRLNAGTGMALGAIIAAVIALAVQLITGNSTIWNWAIPVGVAVGLAIGVSARGTNQQDCGPGGKNTP